jgi:hypothetical protein
LHLDGGLETLYAAGTVGTGSGGTVNAYMNSSGNIYASNDINAGHQVNTQYVWASGILTLTIFTGRKMVDFMLVNGGEYFLENSVGEDVHLMDYRAEHQQGNYFHV